MGKAVDENLESGFLLKAKHYLTKKLLIFQGNFTRPSQITSHFEIPPPIFKNSQFNPSNFQFLSISLPPSISIVNLRRYRTHVTCT
jgi:hypothetical protein